MLKKLIIVAAVAIFAACDKTEKTPSEAEYGVFSFDEAESIVPVSPSTGSCDLKCHYIKMPADKYYGIWPLVWFDERKSTALPNVHFVDETIFPFTGNGSANLNFELKLIPENITEEVSLVLKTRATMKNVAFSYDEESGSLELFGAIDPTTGAPYEEQSSYDGFIGETKIILRPVR